MTVPGLDWIGDRVDPVALVRGASLGFTVLALGGLALPIGARVPVVGPAWLVIIAVLAFASAGNRIGEAPDPRVHGAAAAVAAYLLVVPLVVMGTGTIDPRQLFFTVLAGMTTGAAAGRFAGWRRDRAEGTARRGRERR